MKTDLFLIYSTSLSIWHSSLYLCQYDIKIHTCSLLYVQVIQVEAEHERWAHRFQNATNAAQRQQRNTLEREQEDRDKVINEIMYIITWISDNVV